MKLLLTALLITSFSVSAGSGYETPSIADTLVNNRIEQLQQQMDTTSGYNQELRMQREANDIARERLDYERSRNDEIDFRRAINAR